MRRVVDEMQWYRRRRGLEELPPRGDPMTTDCAEDIKKFILRFWPKLPRLSDDSRQMLSAQSAFWNRVALQRLRFGGERHWYLVAHTFDTGERVLVLRVPPPSFATEAARLEHASRQATYNDDDHGRHEPGMRASDELITRLRDDETHLRDGILYGFPILKHGRIPRFLGDNYPSCAVEYPEPSGKDLDRQIAAGVLEGPLLYTPHSVCSLGMVYHPPPKDKYRLVWDLTASGVNPHVFVPETKYDMLTDVLRLQRPKCWQSGFDMSDAFWNWSRRQRDTEYMGVRHPVTGHFYRARFAIFGAADSPYVQASMAQVIKRILNTEGLKYCRPGPAADYDTVEVTGMFVDDGHIVHDASLTYDEAADQLRSMLRVMSDLGLACSDKKTQWPAKVKEFVGVNIDSVECAVSITPSRAAKYIAVLDQALHDLHHGDDPHIINRSAFASIVGKLQFCAELVPGGQGLLSKLYHTRDNLSRFDYSMRTVKGQWRKDVTIRTDTETPRLLARWRSILSEPISRRYYLTKRPSERGFWKGETEDTEEYLDAHWATSEGIPVVKMDASKRTAAIAYRDDRHIHLFPKHEQHPHESSNYRELTCFKLALQRWGHLWKGQRVLGRSDNSTSVTVIRKQGTTAPRLLELSNESNGWPAPSTSSSEAASSSARPTSSPISSHVTNASTRPATGSSTRRTSSSSTLSSDLTPSTP